MIVLDASAVLELLLATPAGHRVADRIGEESLHAPHLLYVEAAQALRRYEAAGELTEAEGRRMLADLVDLDIERYDHDLLLPRVWDLRRNATAYDAVYLALAELLNAPLLTLDRRLAGISSFRGTVEIP